MSQGRYSLSCKGLLPSSTRCPAGQEIQRSSHAGRETGGKRAWVEKTEWTWEGNKKMKWKDFHLVGTIHLTKKTKPEGNWRSLTGELTWVGYGSNILEHGFKLSISTHYAGLLPSRPYFYFLINGTLIKKWMLPKASKQRRHERRWIVVYILKKTTMIVISISAQTGKKRIDAIAEPFVWIPMRLKLLAVLYWSSTKLPVKYTDDIR